ncbi:GNAT family N-acetyltransferase [Cytobacillus spongiae]|jgi:ribosomal protein S18 acetylase RimI-like enzyme|uniref:GNAT family N-acetyltransferase n=1 Tax=Cytobacillus spongiae TaxID=2901381 RepID=UPI001F29473F|nr:GNAT family N-acetyltransferase [Cytobacillus spongiae]UII57593.1 GNAT family N-acetyltransferase [Cytobacillus spongiae]
MGKPMEVRPIDSIEKNIEELSNLLVLVVNEGASIGFLPPLSDVEADAYWRGVLGEEVTLLVATLKDEIVGTVQVHASTKPNGRHRVEIAKLMTHPNYRKQGIGRLLMNHAEDLAKAGGKKLIVLDTREGDASNFLYQRLGYTKAGKIPSFALSENGSLDATIIYYKELY